MNKIKIIQFPIFLLFLIFIFFEILIRVYFLFSENDITAFKNYPGRYSPSYFNGYELTKNWQLNHKNLEEKINQFGFKSNEITINKPDNTFRIICVGGSLVYGLGNDNWPYNLNKILNENKLNNIKYEVINAGVPGYTSYHTLTQLATKLIDFQPDLIIYYQMFTDLWYFHKLNKDIIIGDNFAYFVHEPLKKIIDKSYLLTFLNAFYKKYIIKKQDNEQLYKDTPLKIFNENDLMYYDRNVSMIASICNSLDIKLIFCNPLTLFKKNNTPEEILQIADYKNINFYLDYTKTADKILKKLSNIYKNIYHLKLSDEISPSIRLLNDRYHLNTEGNIQVAKKIHYFIKNQILQH